MEGIMKADNAAVKAIYQLALLSVISWEKENSGTEDDARDVFQEALMALFRKLESGDFTLTCTLKSFLRIMCRNLWLGKLRNKHRQMKPLENVEEVSLDDDMQIRLEQSEKQQLFFKHFDALGYSNSKRRTTQELIRRKQRRFCCLLHAGTAPCNRAQNPAMNEIGSCLP